MKQLNFLKVALMSAMLLFAFCAASFAQATVVFSEDFSKFTRGTANDKPSSTEITDTVNKFTQTLGWTGTKVYEAGGAAKLGTKDLLGSLQTPAISLIHDNGNFTVKFKAMAWKNDADSIYVRIINADTVTETKVIKGLGNTDAYTLEEYELNLSTGGSATKIKFEAVGTNKARFFLDDIEISQILPLPAITINTPADGKKYLITEPLYIDVEIENFVLGTDGIIKVELEFLEVPVFIANEIELAQCAALPLNTLLEPGSHTINATLLNMDSTELTTPVAASTTFTLRGLPALTINTPADGETYWRNENLSIDVKIENFVLGTDGIIKVEIEGIEGLDGPIYFNNEAMLQGMIAGLKLNELLLSGTYKIDAELLNSDSTKLTTPVMASTTFTLSLRGNTQTIWDGTADTKWYTNNPDATTFYIYTAEELAGLASIVNAGTTTFQGKTVELKNEIWLNTDGSTTNKWTPIGGYPGGATSTEAGTDGSNKYFEGTFNGNYHLIHNMYVNRGTNKAHAGLFGSIKASSTSTFAKVENVVMVNPISIGHSMLGCVIGFIGNGGPAYVENCQVVNGSITATNNNNGLIVGAAWPNGNSSRPTYITNCAATGTVKGQYIGGIVGNGKRVTMKNSYFAGTLTRVSNNNNYGGIAGIAENFTGTNNYSNTAKSTAANSQEGTIKTLTEMRDPSFVTLLGDAIYKMDNGLNDGLPILIDVEYCNGPKNLTISDITETSAKIKWDQGEGETTWTLGYRIAGGKYHTKLLETTSYLFEGLLPFTSYEFYISTECQSSSSGKAYGHFMTLDPAPAMAPYTNDFEGDEAGNWSIANDTSANKWYVGYAQGFDYDNKLFISSTRGNTNKYNATQASIAQAYRSMIVPEEGAYFTFDYRVGGNANDYLMVSAIPQGEAFIAGTIPSTNLAILTGANEWKEYMAVLEKGTYVLVFTWVNDDNGENQFPAAIDNISVQPITCVKPSDLVVNVDTTGGAVKATVSWTADEDQNKWIVEYAEVGKEASYSKTVTDTITTLTSIQPNSSYTISVKAVCEDGESLPLHSSFSVDCIKKGFGARGDEVICETTTITTTYPVNHTYDYGYGQQIYNQSLLPQTPGYIYSISFYPTGSNSVKAGNNKIWLQNTDKVSFSSASDFVPNSELTEVYDGTGKDWNIVANTWNEFVLDEPFYYEGGNLLLAFLENKSGWTTISFRAVNHNNGVNTAIGARRDGSPIDVSSPPAATDIGTFNNMIKLDFMPYVCNDELLCPTPELVSSDITATSATISWEANTDVESWTVEYKKSEETTWTILNPENATVALTELESNTSYDVRAIGYCSEISRGEYSDVLTFTTPFGCTEIPQNIASVNSSNTTTLTWDAGEYTAWEVQLKKNSDSEWSSFIVEETTIAFSGLDVTTSYNFRVCGLCGEDFFSNWATHNFTSGCDATTVLPVYEQFTNNATPDCWINLDNKWTYSGGVARSAGTNPNNWLISNGIQLPETGATLAFDVALNTEGSERIEVLVSERGTDMTTFASLEEVIITKTEYNKVEVTLPESLAGKTIYLAFVHNTAVSNSTVLLDNITIANCFDVPVLAVSYTGDTYVKLAWETDEATQFNLQYVKGSATTWNTIPVEGNEYTVTGLDLSSNYSFRIQSVCSNGGQSDYSNTVTTVTACMFISELPHFDNFDSYTTGQAYYPTCWTVYKTSTASGTPYIAASDNPPSSPRCLDFHHTNSGYNLAILPPLDQNINIHDIKLSFKALQRILNRGQFLVGIMDSPIDLESFTVIDTVNGIAATTWYDHATTFENYTGSGRYIAFKMLNGYGGTSTNNTFLIDNLLIDLINPPFVCPVPVISYTQQTDSIIVTWAANEDAAEWIVEYKFDYENSYTALPAVTAPKAIIENLVSGNTYNIRVKAICAADDQSGYSDVLTISYCSDPQEKQFSTAGSTTTNNYLPLNTYNANSASQQIYLASEMGGKRVINGISFELNSGSFSNKSDVYIFLVHTDRTTFPSTSDYISAEGLTPVYHGPLNCSAGWNYFEFDNSFIYNGTDNLALLVFDHSGQTGSTVYFKTHAISNQRSIYYYSYAVANKPSFADPRTNGTGGNLSSSSNAFRVNTKFHSCGDYPAIDIVVDDIKSYSYCDLTNLDVEFTFTQIGTDSVDTVMVSYAIDGVAGVTDTLAFDPPLTYGKSYTHKFKNPVSFLNDENTLAVTIETKADENLANNTKAIVLERVAPQTIPYTEDFSAVDVNDNGWRVLDQNNDNTTWAVNNGVLTYVNDTIAANDWVMTSCLDIPAGKYDMSFAYNALDTLKESFDIYIGTVQNNPATMTKIKSYADFAKRATNYGDTILLEIPDDDIYYIGIHAKSPKKSAGIIFDNLVIKSLVDMAIVSVDPIPDACDLSSVPVTATVMQQNAGSVSEFVMTYTVGDLTVSELVKDTLLKQGDTYRHEFSNYANLTETDNTITVKVIVEGDTYLEDNVKEISGIKLVTPSTMPYTENFSDVTIGKDGWWTIDGNGDNVTWTVANGVLTYFANDTLGAYDDVYSPCLDIPAGKYEISYNYNALDVFSEDMTVFISGEGYGEMLGWYEFARAASDYSAVHLVEIPADDIYYIGIWADSEAGTAGITFDNLAIVPMSDVTIATDGNGTVSGENSITVYKNEPYTLAITPNPGYHVAGIYVNGELVEGEDISAAGHKFFTFTPTENDVYVYVEFESNMYVINASIHNYLEENYGMETGTITPKGIVEVAHGADQTFFITTAQHFHIYDVLVDGVSAMDDLTEISNNEFAYTFENVTKNARIQVLMTIDSLDIILNVHEGIGIVCGKTADASEGIWTDIYTLPYGAESFYTTIVPATGYSVESFLNNRNVGAVQQYNLFDIKETKIFDIHFYKNTYTISTQAYGKGTITEGVTFVYDPDFVYEYEVTPNTGYYITSVTVNGVEQTITDPDAFSSSLSSISQDYEIIARFAMYTYAITAEAGNGGAITPVGTTVYNYGSAATYVATANAGYYISSTTVDGTTTAFTAADNKTTHAFAFDNIISDHAVAVEFAIHTFEITATAGANGTIDPTGTEEYDYGTTQTYTITPNTGYYISTVTVDGAVVENFSGNTYTFVNIADDHTIAVTFTRYQYAITAGAANGGTITPSGTTTVNHGANQAYTVTAGTGYTVSTVVIDGTPTAVNAATFSHTFSNVTANHAIYANFELKSYTVTVTQPANGAITPGTQVVNHGANAAFQITPNEGYEIQNIKVNGTNVTFTADASGAASHTISNITANTTITATMKIKTYTITATAGTGGSISPSGTATVDYGATATYTITPNAGYEIEAVVVDGAVVGKMNSFAFAKVTSNRTISVTFAPIVCDAPTQLHATEIDYTSAKLNWLHAGADSYTVTYSKLGGIEEVVTGVTGNFFVITELDTNSRYEWTVKAVCSASSSSVDAPYSSFKTKARPVDTGIDSFEGTQINVYSNLNNVYIVNEAGVEIKNVDIYNVYGKLIYTGNALNNPEVINLNVATGTYMVRVVADGKIGTFKVFIQ
ncbi:fibronectin type III domain-containing protein [Bacteroidales bacterium OttesenSCG-928-B11]|nr:fibronectin type III domain-containing protein [Bacteroidales bacterium OttesenSCG-928-C03]MDL2311983.1 fibronectin type III domain-containing protein [Bacteroidales bacterium OttesenSCG-928-B11]